MEKVIYVKKNNSISTKHPFLDFINTDLFFFNGMRYFLLKKTTSIESCYRCSGFLFLRTQEKINGTRNHLVRRFWSLPFWEQKAFLAKSISSPNNQRRWQERYRPIGVEAYYIF